MDDNARSNFAQAARERYAALGAAWLVGFGITLRKVRSGLSGRGSYTSRTIEGPWPTTTRKRLYIIAHEIGHVALGHKAHGLPQYVKEFECEQFAHGLMRRCNVAVPREMTTRAKNYVAYRIRLSMRRGGTAYDPEIAAWAGCEREVDMFLANRSVGRGLCFYHAESMQRVAKALEAVPAVWRS